MVRLRLGGFSSSLYFPMFYNEKILLFNKKKQKRMAGPWSRKNLINQENENFKTSGLMQEGRKLKGNEV